MPILNLNLWQSFQLLYDIAALPTRPDIRLSYHRAVLFDRLYKDRVEHIPQALGWTSTTRIAVLACGFGWFVEQLQAHGFINVIGADISTFVQANKNTTEEADINAAITLAGLSPLVGEGQAIKGKLYDGGLRSRVTILNEDGQTNGSRTRIRQALSNIQVIYTELLLQALTDSEAVTVANALRQIAPCVHLFSTPDPSQPGLLNWKTGPQWKALIPQDTFVEDGPYTVF